MSEGRRAVDLAHRSGFLTERVSREAELVDVMIALGMLDDAEEALGRCLAEVRRDDPRGAQSGLLRRLALIAEARGDLLKAEVLSADSLELCCGSVESLAEVHLTRGRILASTGRTEDARRHLEDAVRFAEAVSHAVQATARARLAALDQSEVAAAADLLEELRGRLPVQADMESSFLLFQAGAGEDHLERARTLLARLREHAPEECRRSMMENAPLHREIADST